MAGRGRPIGTLTATRRRALAYVQQREAAGKPVILGEMMRRCGFSCRSNAKRTLNDLRRFRFIEYSPSGEICES